MAGHFNVGYFKDWCVEQGQIGVAIATSIGLVLGTSVSGLADPMRAIAPVSSSSQALSNQALTVPPRGIATRNMGQTAAAELPPLQNPNTFLPVPNPIADTRLVISLGDRRVYVYDREQVKASFPVAIGRGGWETPTGEFQVMLMLRDPRWEHPFTGEVFPPGGSNPLGSRWIGFWSDGRNTIGFHGTPNESSVGRAASHGCVRMYNRDVQALFEMVAVGTPVTVRL